MNQNSPDTIALAPEIAHFHNFATTFEKMESSDFQLIFEHGKRMSILKNVAILEQGQANNSLFVITQGIVRVERHLDGTKNELAMLGPWTVFGEMSFLDKQPVSADVITTEPTTLIRIDGSDIEEFISDVPGFAHRFYQSLAITISRRLRLTSAYV